MRSITTAAGVLIELRGAAGSRARRGRAAPGNFVLLSASGGSIPAVDLVLSEGDAKQLISDLTAELEELHRSSSEGGSSGT